MFKMLAAVVVLLVPVTASFAQLNESMEPLGGTGTEGRLRKLISDTVRPVTRPAAAISPPAAEPPWSQPVGGLTARVEYVDWHSYGGLVVLVHLKNVWNMPLTVPAGNPVDPKAPHIFELHVQRGEQQWKWLAWFPAAAATNQGRGGQMFWADKTGNNVTRAPVALRPGESVLAYLCGTAQEDLQHASRIKILIRQPAGGGGWGGILETPPHPARPASDSGAARPATLPFPEYFPEFSRVGSTGINGSGRESSVDRLSISNRALGEALASYEAEGLCRELDRRIALEKDEAMKFYLAGLAARRGSTVAALVLLDAMTSTEYETTRNVHCALRMALYNHASDPPDWLVELAVAALADQRYVTGLKKTNWSQGTQFTISYLADEDAKLTWAMGHLKCRKAIPVLTEMVRRNQSSGAIDALGDIGGGLEVVLEVLRTQEKNVAIRMGMLEPESFRCAARAAGQLKAREVVPILLRNLCHQDVIEVLEATGDPAAIPALEKVVADGRPQRVEGETIESVQNSVWAARIALAALKEGDPLPRYWQLLADRSMGEFARRTVVWRLGSHPNRRSVPHLLAAIRTDPSGAVVNQAITVLSEFKYKPAVAGLIDCFDADFRGKEDWKRAYKPEMFQENIAQSLQAITGQPFGPDKEQWAKWWRDQGEKQSDLK